MKNKVRKGKQSINAMFAMCAMFIRVERYARPVDWACSWAW